MQPRGECRVKFRDHAPEAGQLLGQFAGVGVSVRAGPRGQGNLVDGHPEHGEPYRQSRTHDRSLGGRHHDRDAFRLMRLHRPRRAVPNGATGRPDRLITTFRLWTTLRHVWTI
jgi:hypothetical protein